MTVRNVLISAYACGAGEGSEPGAGWNLARQLAERHRVWLITREKNRCRIEPGMQQLGTGQLRVVYYELPRWARWWKRGRVSTHLYYYLWQFGAYRVARQLHRHVHFDVAHHVTFGSCWMPSFMALLPAPFVWGPLGGGETAPRAFVKEFGLRGRVYEILRKLARWLGEHDPFVRIAPRGCAVALASTEQTATRLRRMGVSRVQEMFQMGLAKEEIKFLGELKAGHSSRLRLISCGRLLHWKGFELGLRAFATAALADAEYWIVGDGPQRRRLESLAQRLGIGRQVRLWGRLPRMTTLRLLGECDVLVHPSLHEAAGTVCLEAMAARKPVICLNVGGPAVQVNDDCGFPVAAVSAGQAVADMAQAMRKLAADPVLRHQMGEAGRQRVIEQFSWESKVAKIEQIYESVCAQGHSLSAAEKAEQHQTQRTAPEPAAIISIGHRAI